MILELIGFRQTLMRSKGDFKVQIDKLRGKQLDQLFKAMKMLEGKEEYYKFFDDIATMNEIQALAQRFQVAKMLNEGATYNEIEAETKASTATISRVRRALTYGSGGYKTVLSRLNKDL